MQPAVSIPKSQAPTTCHYPEPDKSNPGLLIPFLENPFQYYSSIYAYIFQVVSFPHVSPPKLCRHFSYPPYLLLASPVTIFYCITQIIFNEKHLLTYLLTPWCRVFLEKLTDLQLVKKFPAFHGTRRFVTALTSVRHLSLSWASPIQSIYPHPNSWSSILILSTHLRLGLPSGLLHSGFPTKTLYSPLSSPIRATCPAHLILLDFITRTILGEDYKPFSSSLCNLLHSPVTSSLLGPNILLNTMFSNTLSFFSSRNFSDQVSHL